MEATKDREKKKKQESSTGNNPSTRELDKQEVVHPYNKIQLSEQKAQPSATRNKVEESQYH